MSDAVSIDTMGPAQLFDHLMGTKYVPDYMATMRRESERRTDAFAEASYTVCGEELRLMTPRDLLMLDGFENAFVCLTEPTSEDLSWFLWTLNVTNNGSRSWRNRWHKGRCYGRVAAREDEFQSDVLEVYAYLDRLWLDEPADTADGDTKAKKPSKPAGVYCLAPLMVNVAGVMGAIDPMSGRLLADVPIPRLLQYQRAATERKAGEAEATSFDSLRSRCLEEVNYILAERRKCATA